MFTQVIRASTRATPSRSVLRYQYRQHLARTSQVRTAATASPTTLNTENSGREERTVFIRTWSPLRNIADAYALMDAMEKKYGKIVNARFLKDFEDPTKFQMFLFLTFAEPIAKEIPDTGLHFTIPSSGIAKEQHEISLADLERFMTIEGRDPEFELTKESGETSIEKDKVIGGTIRRGALEYVSDDFNNLNQPVTTRVMRSFLRWGGFHEIKPLEKPRKFEERDLFKPTDVDHIRMRAALQQSAFILRLPNPNNPQIVVPSEAKVAKKADAEPKASSSSPSLGALAFGGLQEEASNKGVKKTKAPSTETTSRSTLEAPKPESVSTSPSSPPEPVLEASTSPSPRSKPIPVPLTADQIAAKEALRKQLEFAKQLKQTLGTPHTYNPGRKQAKPSVKPPKPPKQEREPEFYESDYIPPTPEPERKGVLGRLWSMFERK